MSDETPFEVARRMHREGASAEVVVAALRTNGLSEEDATIAARAARGEAGFATNVVQDVPLPPVLPTEPPSEVPSHACPRHEQWPVLGTCARCGSFFCAKCALDAGLRDVPADKLCPECSKREPEGPVGIGGWLILPALQVVISPFVTIASMVGEAQWVTHEKVGVFIAIELLVLAAYAIYTVLTAIALFSRRRVAVRMMIGFYVTAIVISLGTQVLISIISSIMGTEAAKAAGALRGVGGSVIWLVYFLTSKRVKATFTR